MVGSVFNSRDILRIDRLVYVPVILLLIGIWTVTIDFKLDDRAELLAAAEDELNGSVDTLSDAEMLLRQNPVWSENERQATRESLIQNELRSHPNTTYWMDSDGAVFAGKAFEPDWSFIYAIESRGGITVHAAVLKEAVLTGWRESLDRWVTILAILSVTALAIAGFLARTLRRSAIAEMDLRKRDAILSVINNAATVLASAESYESVINDILASFGSAVGVGRVALRTQPRFTTVKRVFEWHKPNMPALGDYVDVADADFEDIYTPEQLAQMMRGDPLRLYIDDLPAERRDFLVEIGMMSSLVFAFIVDGQPYCSLGLTDTYDLRRDWTQTEIDALRTFTGVIAAAITRTHQMRERSKAEAKLFNRDAILQAVTDSAASLLNAQDLDKGINETLAALGQAIGLSRVYLSVFSLTDDQRVLMNVSHEWLKTGLGPLKTHPIFINTDVTSSYPPAKLAEAYSGREEAYFLEDMRAWDVPTLIALGIRTFFTVTLMVEGQFYGNLVFASDDPDRNSWTPTEIRTLKTVTQLVSAALDHAHQARERSKAETKLFNRDAILQAVTDSTAKLLANEDPDQAIPETLATLGRPLGLSRIYFAAYTQTDDGRVFANLVHEWFKPGMIAGKGHPALTNADITAFYPPERLAAAASGREEAFFPRDLSAPDRATMLEMGTFASLAIPVMVDGEFRGNLVFADDSPERSSWTPTEIATLKTLTQLVGAALARARYLEQRKKAVANIEMRERALEGISQGVGIVDLNVPERPVIYANTAFATMMRYPIDEIIGKSAFTFVHGPQAEGSAERLNEAIATRRPWRVERQVMRKDGTLFLNSITSTFIFNDAGQLTHMVSINEDVTELRKQEELLLEARKMEGIGHLTGGIAHDFNNLLTAIRSNAEDLRDDLQDELQRTQAEIVLEAAERGAGLVAQLLAFARKQELAPENIAINSLVAAFTKQLARTMPANIEIETKSTDDLPMVHIDPGRLEAAIQHLALNARDAMPDGGTITIETSLKILDSAEAAELSGVKPGSYVLLAVTDSGSGMPREILDKAFTPFFTTKEVGKGSGLGLSMVYGFLKQSGGYVRIYSEVGLGTVVKLYLPLTIPAAASEDGPPLAAGAGAILVVDDDKDVRQNVGMRLANLGYQVTDAENAQEAIDILKATPHFDLVFSDVIMPGPMNGADLVHEVHRRWPEMGVLLMSGYTEATIFAKVQVPPGARLLSKPFSNQELARAVHEALARRKDKVA